MPDYKDRRLLIACGRMVVLAACRATSAAPAAETLRHSLTVFRRRTSESAGAWEPRRLHIVGKSTLLRQVAGAVSMGCDWLTGEPAGDPGVVLSVGEERPGVVRRRFGGLRMTHGGSMRAASRRRAHPASCVSA